MINFNFRSLSLALVVTAITLLLSFLLAPFIPPAVDWITTFRPATLALLSGESPYGRFYLVHAPWTLMLLAPFALLPEAVGRVMMIFSGLISYMFIAKRLHAKPVAIVFLLVSPVVMHMLLNGNIDWLASLGFVLPPQIGLFFISIKPQVGIAVVPFWVVEAWRLGGWKLVIKTFAPFTFALLISFLIFGFWPSYAFSYRVSEVWFNASLWPMSIPVGLALLVASIRRRKIEYSLAASPCLSPYALFYSWTGALLAIVSSTPETIAAVVGLWILVAIRYFA